MISELCRSMTQQLTAQRDENKAIIRMLNERSNEELSRIWPGEIPKSEDSDSQCASSQSVSNDNSDDECGDFGDARDDPRDACDDPDDASDGSYDQDSGYSS